MKANYKWVIDRIIKKYEGGYSNDAGDPGGPTMYGITYIDLAQYLHVDRSQTYNMMPHMSLATAEAIYSSKYEKGSRFDDLQSGVDMCVMDYDINSGLSRGARSLQAILGLPQTGVMNDATVYAANKVSADKLIDAICDERLNFMHRIRGGSAWTRFGKGWGARVADLRVTAKGLASKEVVEAPAVVDQMFPADMGKATHMDPVALKTVAKYTAGGSLSTAGAGHVYVGDVLTTLGIAVTVCVIGGIVYYEVVRSQSKAQKLVVVPPSAKMILKLA